MRAANERIVGVAPSVQLAPTAHQPVASLPPAYDAYDPFHLADDDGDDVPFDAPTEADLSDLIDDAECMLLDTRSEPAKPVSEPHLPGRAVKAPLALKPVRPVIPEAPRDRTYLYAARQAARNAQSRRRVFPSTKEMRFSGSVAALAVLLGVGVVALRALPHMPAPSPASAAAASPVQTLAQSDPQSDYADAIASIEAGGVRDGLSLLQRAADAGFAPAQYRLAKAFENGDGVEQDLARARELTERAALAGNCRAMHDAGVFLARGEGIAMDETAAARWFRAAAERGVADSQYNLALLHQQGRGVSQSSVDALYWYLVAARSHDVNAVERAVEVAALLTPEQVQEARTRARAFRARPSDPHANGVFEPANGFNCASV